MRIFDAHFHIIDPTYPLTANNGYIPAPYTVTDHMNTTKGLDIVGGVVVSGSFQAYDQNYLLASLQQLGTRYFGVTNIQPNISKEELDLLSKERIVGIRFNLKRGNLDQLRYITRISNELYDKYNWHTELYVDNKDLQGLTSILKTIPDFSIDHLGLSKEGLNDLYYWVERGVKVKATGFGRLDFSPIPVMKLINSINPKALLFGTDLPSTRAKTPFTQKDVELIKENFSIEELKRILYSNASEWYNKTRS